MHQSDELPPANGVDIRMAQLGLYVANHRHDRLTTPLLGIMTALMLEQWLPSWQVAAWAIATVLATVFAMSVYHRFGLPGAAERGHGYWERRLGLAHGIHMLVWASLPVWAWQSGDAGNNYFITLIMAGVAAATAAMSSSHKSVFVADMIPAIAALTVRPLLEGEFALLGLGAVFSYLMFAVGREGHGSTAAMLRLREQNRCLIDRLARQARTDPLTELYNRRAFTELAEAELARCRRHDCALSVLVLDIDHFKAVNDRFGHPAGDAVICAIAALCRGVVRDSDSVARMGGEEFAVLLPESGPDGAQRLAERLRSVVERHVTESNGHSIAVTVSIGVASLQSGDDVDSLLVRADKALYAAKGDGRNRVNAA